jgi:hypothetical protein
LVGDGGSVELGLVRQFGVRRRVSTREGFSADQKPGFSDQAGLLDCPSTQTHVTAYPSVRRRVFVRVASASGRHPPASCSCLHGAVLLKVPPREFRSRSLFF